MAYQTEHWNCVIPGVGNQPRLWLAHGTDVHSDVDATGFVNDGAAKGMQVNDVVIYVRTTATIGATTHVVTALSADGAATLSAAILA